MVVGEGYVQVCIMCIKLAVSKGFLNKGRILVGVCVSLFLCVNMMRFTACDKKCDGVNSMFRDVNTN